MLGNTHKNGNVFIKKQIQQKLSFWWILKTHPQENLRWPNSKSSNCIVSSNSCPPWKPKWPAHSPELWQQPKSPSSPSEGQTWVLRTPSCFGLSWRNCQNSSPWSSNLSVPPTWWRRSEERAALFKSTACRRGTGAFSWEEKSTGASAPSNLS